MFLLNATEWWFDFITPWNDPWAYVYSWALIAWLGGALIRRYAPSSCPQPVTKYHQRTKHDNGYYDPDAIARDKKTLVHLSKDECYSEHFMWKYHVAYRNPYISLTAAAASPIVFALLPFIAAAWVITIGYLKFSDMGRMEAKS